MSGFLAATPLPKYSFEQVAHYFQEFYGITPRALVMEVPDRGTCREHRAIMFYKDVQSEKVVYVKRPTPAGNVWQRGFRNCFTCNNSEAHLLLTLQPVLDIVEKQLGREHRFLPQWRLDGPDREFVIMSQAPGYDFDRAYKLFHDNGITALPGMDADKLLANSAQMYGLLEFASDADCGIRHVFLDPSTSDFCWIDHSMAYSTVFYHEVNIFAKRVKDLADAVSPRPDPEYHSEFFSHYQGMVEAMQHALQTVDDSVMRHLSGNTRFTKIRMKELRDKPSTLKFLQEQKEAAGFTTDYSSIFEERGAVFNNAGGYR